MTLSIRGSGASSAGQHFQELAAEATQRNQERLASGRRINRAADDGAGLAIARRLEAAVRGSARGEQNLADGQSLVRTADASLQSSQDAVSRLRELSIQAQNGTLSQSDRDVIQQEFDQLSAQLDQTASGTQFAGRTLLDGSVSGNDAIVLDDGSGSRTAIELRDASAAGLGVAGLSVGDPNTVSALDYAGATLASERARLGAIDNALGSHRQQLAVTRSNAEDARSRIEDVDVARAAADATRGRILSQLQLAGQRINEAGRGRLVDLIG